MEPSGRSTRIELEVVHGLEPIRGEARDESGKARRVSGWIELTSLLEGMRIGRERNDQRTGRQE